MFQRYFMSVGSAPFTRIYVNIIFHINVCSVCLEISKLSERWNSRGSQSHQAAKQLLSYVYTNSHCEPCWTQGVLIRIYIVHFCYTVEIALHFFCLDIFCINISILVTTRELRSEMDSRCFPMIILINKNNNYDQTYIT